MLCSYTLHVLLWRIYVEVASSTYANAHGQMAVLQENEEAFDAKFSAATFKHLQFKLRARLDNYQVRAYM